MNTEKKESYGFVDKAISTLSSSEEISRGEIEGTPFNIGRFKDEYYLLLGMVRLNKEPLNGEKEVLAMSKRKDWNMIVMVMSAVGLMQKKIEGITLNKVDDEQ